MCLTALGKSSDMHTGVERRMRYNYFSEVVVAYKNLSEFSGTIQLLPIDI